MTTQPGHESMVGVGAPASNPMPLDTNRGSHSDAADQGTVRAAAPGRSADGDATAEEAVSADRETGDTMAAVGEARAIETDSVDEALTQIDPDGFADEGDQVASRSEPLEKRYELRERLGRGGMGEVWKAFDTRLNRSVAIKRIRGEDLSGNVSVGRRFLKEAQAIARLSHFNIVQIYDFGYDVQGPYLVLEFVPGESLGLKLQREGALSLEQSLRIALALCDALCCAHQQGIVHRDIKPENILLVEDGHAKLTDFGIAHCESNDVTQTRTGTILGTIAYMAPEQQAGVVEADARSDQWSLAATFYQMLTGSVPRVIRESMIPESVRETLLKALEEDPRNRYPSIAEFRECLALALPREEVREASGPAPPSGDRTQAVPCGHCGATNDPNREACASCEKSLLEPCTQCGKKNPPLATFCQQCKTNLAEAIVERRTTLARECREIEYLRQHYRIPEALSWLDRIVALDHPRLRDFRDWATVVREKYGEDLKQLVSQVGDLRRQAVAALRGQQYDTATYILERIPQSLRNDQDALLLGEANRCRKEIENLKNDIRHAVLARQYDRNLLLKIQRYRALRPGDTTAQNVEEKLVRKIGASEPIVLSGHKGTVTGVTFGPEDTIAATCAWDGVAMLWNPLTGELLRKLEGHQGIVWTVAMDGDGGRLLTGGEDKTALVWSTADGKVVRELRGHDGAVRTGVFSRDGETAITGSWDNTIIQWDIDAGTAMTTLTAHEGAVRGLAISPDGKLLVSGSSDTTAILWDLENEEPMHVLKHDGWVTSVAFSPNGKLVAAGTSNKRAFLWDVETGEQVGSFRGHEGRVLSLAFAPRGQHLITGAGDGAATLWDVSSGQAVYSFPKQAWAINSVVFSNSGDHVLFTCAEKARLIQRP